MAPIVSGMALTTIVARRAIAPAPPHAPAANAALPRMLRRNLTQRLRLAEPWHVLSK